MTRFYTPIQSDQALKSPIFGRLHVSRSIERGRIRPRLPQQGLQGHGLMDTFDLGMIRWAGAPA